jgi:TolB-like protein/class 3 adenylate cyclase
MAEGGVQRRLAAIVIADLVGYSRHMERDPTGTRERFLAIQQELVEPILAKHEGRIVKTMGDAFLLEFASVVSAVAAVVEFQRAMTTGQATEADPIKFRIGVNLGEIIVEGDDIHGDGVNVAARLEALAEPGGIVLSGRVHEQLRDDVDVGYEFMGEQQVKNVERLVRAYKVLLDPADAGKAPTQTTAVKSTSRPYKSIATAFVLLVALVGGGYWFWQSHQPDFEPADQSKFALKLPDKPSIAVLPFDYLGSDTTQNEWMADGLSENIIASLSHIPELLVIARNSTFIYKGKSVDVRHVSEQFGVRYVLEGSLQRSDDRLRITAQLIDAISGRHIWAETYDRPQEDIFAVQDEITLAIAQNILSKTVTGINLKPSDTTNLAAWKLFLKAKEAQYQFTKPTQEKAKEYVRKALEIDPKFYGAMTLLAFSHIMDARLGLTSTPKESLRLAEDLLQKALAESPDKTSAYMTMATLRLVQKRKEEALSFSKKAYESAPGDAQVASASGWITNYAGIPRDAIRYFGEAKRLQPVHDWWMIGDEYNAYRNAQLYEPLIGELSDKFIAATPKSWLHIILPAVAYIYYKTGDTEKSKALMDEAYALKPDLSLEDFAPTDSAYLDEVIREKRKDEMRELGIPDHPPSAESAKPSIAVLPFANLSDDKDQEYFADGMTDDLITDLSKVSGLIVIARNSVFTYKGKNVKVQEIAKDLNVTHVLEGSVRRAGDEIRINAQLIDAKTGNHLWAERFDRDYSQIFDLQDEVMAKIVSALSLKFSSSQREDLVNSGTGNTDAYDAYLKGLRYYRQFTAEDFVEAVAMLQQAIDLDNNYSKAHAALAGIYWDSQDDFRNWFKQLGFNFAPQAIDKSQAHLKLAMLNPTPGALMVKAAKLLADDQWEEAIATGRRAITLDPNDADAHVGLARILGFAGHAEDGLILMKKAMRLNPSYSPRYAYILGFLQYLSGNYNQAIKTLEEANRLSPTISPVSVFLLASYGHLGLTDKASKLIIKLKEIRTDQYQDKSSFNANFIGHLPFKDFDTKLAIIEDLEKAGLPAQ